MREGLGTLLLALGAEWRQPYAGLLAASLEDVLLLLISEWDVYPDVGHSLLQDAGLLGP